jgi:iron complex outermembrane receptor protein
MQIYRYILFTLLITLIAVPVTGQLPCRISGRIIDRETGKSLAGANILLEDLNRGTITDSIGNFQFTGLAYGNYTLSASYIGYRVEKLRVELLTVGDLTVTLAMDPLILQGQAVVITATRASEGETPVTFSNISGERIKQDHTVADVPMLLTQLPNTYAYSLSGDELGYTFLKIRGFDQKRIGVMVNDIPLNDPEDQQVYWVDLPDLAESTEDIQVQRGVGSSIYGPLTFGGSVNLKTEVFAAEREIKITMAGGSYNTRKLMAEYKSGLLQNTYAIYARFSRILSDGYRRNSASDLTAYFLGFERYDPNMTTRLNIINGYERTHPDWDGIPQNILTSDRRYKKEMYTNGVDDFNQPQYQLIHTWQISPILDFSNTFYYVRGQGYYENLKEQKGLSEYGMNELETTDPALFGADSLDYYLTVNDTTLFRNGNGKYVVASTDLVRQKWVKKNQYGWIGKLNYDTGKGLMTLGTSIYLFDSYHFGKVLWAKNMPVFYSADRLYHKYNGYKNNFSIYFNYLYRLMKHTDVLTNVLYEHKEYTFKQREAGLFDGTELNRYKVKYDFFNPRLGLNYNIHPDWNLYGNISVSHREPSDDDLFDTFYGPDELGIDPLFDRPDTVTTAGKIQYIQWSDPIVNPETVFDYEAGITYQHHNWGFKLNFYFMDFRNEVVPLGTVDKDGDPVKGNAEQTVHSGMELAFNTRPISLLSFDGNVAFSKNYYHKYDERILDWDTGLVSQRDLSGNPIAGFPDLIANLRLGLNWRPVSASLLFRHIGKQYLDNSGDAGHSIDPFRRLDLILHYQLTNFLTFSEIRFMLKINNLLDEKYETAGYYDPWSETAFFYPAAPRNFYLGVSFYF